MTIGIDNSGQQLFLNRDSGGRFRSIFDPDSKNVFTFSLADYVFQVFLF